MGDIPGPLVGPHELQDLLGVSRTRMRQLIRYPTFPAPFQRLHGTTVWLRADVEAWIAEHRPPRPTDGDEAE
ncbi:hypothetical protein OG470_10030 [Micromonospora sp. NBC_00389]|uniref:helix-turn-helix transcriptional regulator n=1 Tax=Micromonospora sp. NBC_00389 TaxID=2903586 RepID=UPI002E219E86